MTANIHQFPPVCVWRLQGISACEKSGGCDLQGDFTCWKTWDTDEVTCSFYVSDVWKPSVVTLEGRLAEKLGDFFSEPVILWSIRRRWHGNACITEDGCRGFNIRSFEGDWTSFLSSHFYICPKFRSFPLLRLPHFLPFSSHKAILH